MCTNPAKIFGIYPQKGTIQPGSDADIAIWNPSREFTYGVQYSQQRTDYNLYEGWQLKGIIEKVFLRGKLIVDNRDWYGKRGDGRFIKRREYQVL
jgi:dihydropyrimidinase